MSNHDNDRSLEEYLQGDSKLSRQYRNGKREEPSNRLDEAILNAAGESVTKPPSQTWYVPLSIAAVMVIGVSLIFNIYDEAGHQLLTEPDPDFQIQNEVSRDMEGRRFRIENKKEEQEAVLPATEPGAMMDRPAASEDSKPSRIMKRESGIASPAEDKMIWERQKLPEAEQPMERRTLKQENADAPLPKKDAQMKYQGKAIADEMRTVPAEQDALAPANAGAKPKSEVMMEDTTSLGKSKSREDVSGLVSSATEGLPAPMWLQQIRELWLSGKKDAAIANLETFMQTYPDFPQEEIRKQLPDDFDPSDHIENFEMD